MSHPLEVYHVLPRRGGALLIDSLIWAIPTAALAIAVGRSTEPVLIDTADGLVLTEQMTFHLSFLQLWTITALWFVYLIVCEWRFGATLGKMACGIGVVRSDGTSAGIGAVVIRQAPRFALISILSLVTLYWLVPFVFLVEALVARSDEHRQRVDDRLADTVVVRRDYVHRGSAPPPAASGWRPVEVAPSAPGLATAAGYRMYSGFWRRSGAILVDTLFLLALNEVFAIGALTRSMFASSANSAADPFDTTFTASAWIVDVGLNLGYFIWLNGRGGTLGKRLFEIRVIDSAGRAPGIRRAAVRHIIPGAVLLMPLAFAIPVMAGLGDDGFESVLFAGAIASIVTFGYILFSVYDGLSMLWNERRQTLHDRMAGTFVVRKSDNTI